MARRGTVTRFIYNLPMLVDYDTQRFRAEFMRVYVRDPAEVFVVEYHDATPWATGSDKDSYAVLLKFPKLLELLQAEYHPDKSLGRFDLLRLNAVRFKDGASPEINH